MEKKATAIPSVTASEQGKAQPRIGTGECLCRDVGQATIGEHRRSSKSPGMGCSIEGESPVRRANLVSPRLSTARVVQFGSAEQIGRCPSAKAKYCPETDSEQVQ